MDTYKMYEVKASSYEGRLPLKHIFAMPGKDERDVLEAVETRWPALYDINIREK